MKFLSKCPNQVLCVVPNRVQIVDGIVVPVPGKHIRFNNGEYTTTNKKEISFIHNHPLYMANKITEVAEKDAK